jgi:hypothetical protein
MDDRSLHPPPFANGVRKLAAPVRRDYAANRRREGRSSEARINRAVAGPGIGGSDAEAASDFTALLAA